MKKAQQSPNMFSLALTQRGCDKGPTWRAAMRRPQDCEGGWRDSADWEAKGTDRDKIRSWDVGKTAPGAPGQLSAGRMELGTAARDFKPTPSTPAAPGSAPRTLEVCSLSECSVLTWSGGLEVARGRKRSPCSQATGSPLGRGSP